MKYDQEEIYGVSNSKYRLMLQISIVQLDIDLLETKRESLRIKYVKPSVDVFSWEKDLIMTVGRKISKRKAKLNELKKELKHIG